MDLFNLNYEEFERFLLVFSRVGALLLFSPILGSSSVPAKLKIGFALLISFLIAPLVGSQSIPQLKGPFSLAVHMFSEITVGIVIAFAARMIFVAVQVAGTVVDFQMGFGVVNVVDPQTESQVSITAQYMNILATLFFLSLDGHHMVVTAIAESFDLINPNYSFHFSGMTMKYMMNLFTGIFVTAVKFSAPIMAVLFFVGVALGLVARTVPQMNVFIVGFPLQIGIGMFMLWFSLSFFSALFQRQVNGLPGKFIGLMQTF